uniref:Uncharacterized protein n=1 Tax=Rhizophagus irregularis (strain DAOM 181602 / DAOM 197198 / MUCL 43194) TaxID=747089 RepID=U9UB57_RHIID
MFTLTGLTYFLFLLKKDSGEVYRDVLVKGTLIRMPPIRFKKGSWTQRTLCL